MIDLNGEIDSGTIIGEVNTTFSITDRSLGQKINRETANANSTNGLYRLPRAFYPRAAGRHLLQSTPEAPSANKVSLNTF